MEYCHAQGIHINRRNTGGGAIFFDESQLGWEVICDKAFFNVMIPNNWLFKALCEPVVTDLGLLGIRSNFRPRNDIEVYMNMDDMLTQAREMSWGNLGKRITFFLPGIFFYNGIFGRYPAISITGSQCVLQCDHCQGKILETMISAMTPDLLIEKCIRLAERGNHGVLISGGCNEKGRLPWEQFIQAIKKVKGLTSLYISVHSGLIDYETALRLKEAGVEQALIDVIGNDDTYRDIYHVDFGVSEIMSSMESLQKANLPIIPHIVCGLHYGKIKGEKKAVEMIAQFDVEQVVIVSLMRIPGTPVETAKSPSAEEVAEIIAETRFKLPGAQISLGCARERGNTRMELLAIDAGVNRMVIPSEEAIRRAEDYGLDIRYQRTCCSVSKDFSGQAW